jgi:hypothetical protein
VSDFRARFGAQLALAAAALNAPVESDFRARFGAQLALAAAELAGARTPATAAPAGLGGARAPRRFLPGLRPRRLAPGLELADFRVRFGLQLTRAAGELAASRRPLARRVRIGRLPWLTRPVAIALALTAFAGTAFAAVAIWTPLLGNPQYGYNPGAAASAPPQDQLNALAVLRRPQTAADRGTLSQAALTYINDYTTGVRTAYVRLLGTVGDEAFVLVPVEQRDATASTGGTPAESTPLKNALCIYATDSSVGQTYVQCWSLSQITDGVAWAVLNGQLFGLAPDGVATATLSSGALPPQATSVAGNFFVFALPVSGAPPLPGTSLSFTPASS